MTEFKGLEDYYKYLFFYILIIASLKGGSWREKLRPSSRLLRGDVGV
jgi:hypothetical protein